MTNPPIPESSNCTDGISQSYYFAEITDYRHTDTDLDCITHAYNDDNSDSFDKRTYKRHIAFGYDDDDDDATTMMLSIADRKLL